MENASKALMIAGGILIALIVITLFLYMLGNIRTIRQAEEQKIRTEQLQKFNEQYEAYNKKLMYGAEVLSVINKMDDNNKKYKNNTEFQITWELADDELIGNIEKTDVYSCTDIKYSSQTGRVIKMTFKKYDT